MTDVAGAPSEEQRVAALARAFHHAWAASDVATLAPLLAEDYLHVDAHGRTFDRDAWLRYAAEPRDPGELQITDEAVRLLGEVAVITSELILPKLTDVPRARVLQLWRKAGPGWVRTHYQATTVRATG